MGRDAHRAADPPGHGYSSITESRKSRSALLPESSGTIVTAKTGDGPDVLSIDPGLGWLYESAESGDLTVFDLGQPGLVAIDHEHPGDNAHTVAVDPATHRVYFPLMVGPKGTP